MLKCLLALAARLRQLAAGALFQHDQTLYLLAAEALEKHSRELAGAREEAGIESDDPQLYRRVNIIV